MSNQSVHVRSGFTLMEIMIAVAIVGLFAAVGFPAIMRKLDKAKRTNAKVALRGIKDAITEYNEEVHQYPQSLKDLAKDPGVKGWEGPYLTKGVPKDPWGKAYQYSLTEGNPDRPYELYSTGGAKSKSDKKAMISAWDDEE